MLEKEYNFYKKNEQEFLSKYINTYVLIKDDKFIKSFNSQEEALKFALSQFAVGTFLLHLVKPQEDVISYSSRVYV